VNKAQWSDRISKFRTDYSVTSVLGEGGTGVLYEVLYREALPLGPNLYPFTLLAEKVYLP